MSATVCNALEVVLRTPGESINATAKMRRIVFILSGDLNVNLRAINRGQKCSKQLWVVVESNQRELPDVAGAHAPTVCDSLPLQVEPQHLSLRCR